MIYSCHICKAYCDDYFYADTERPKRIEFLCQVPNSYHAVCSQKCLKLLRSTCGKCDCGCNSCINNPYSIDCKRRR